MSNDYSSNCYAIHAIAIGAAEPIAMAVEDDKCVRPFCRQRYQMRVDTLLIQVWSSRSNGIIAKAQNPARFRRIPIGDYGHIGSCDCRRRR